ncbi:hypothetical protein Pla175_26560 [Pirellulimonas nuda]|uniref:Thioredoxin domain-containing protein n=1 Tax=Pirellulimonas nuda TaxID=2528009 RepID=A0A518DCQ9_9BACT|nr:nitrophenyl compound nitroreductase subunit ArsF family protein [Pirellulimonas nuda]QDU89268.1 hypothetical protein Pla175_26560 [Pirellulimonas nuda]
MAASMMLAAVLTAGGVMATGASTAVNEQEGPPAHQVVAIYFHRVERCPTCKRIGAMAEKAVSNGFEKDAETRAVEFHYVNFQGKKNAKLARACGIELPTLVLANVFEGETVCWTSMPEVWRLVGKPDDFRAYVHDGVVRYLKQTKQDAAQEGERRRSPRND